MRISKVLMGLAATALLITGCASKEAPATQALVSAEAALGEVRVDAAKYAPEELKVPEATLAKLKEELAKQDYKKVLAGTPELYKEVITLKETVVSKQTQLVAAANEWEDLSTEVPKMLEAIQSRVDTLSESPRLPKNVNKQAFEAAKSDLETMKATWAEASAAYSAGNTTEAADKARMVQAKGEKALDQLGMSAA
jgi:predicted metalloendopeptidase